MLNSISLPVHQYLYEHTRSIYLTFYLHSLPLPIHIRDRTPHLSPSLPLYPFSLGLAGSTSFLRLFPASLTWKHVPLVLRMVLITYCSLNRRYTFLFFLFSFCFVFFSVFRLKFVPAVQFCRKLRLFKVRVEFRFLSCKLQYHLCRYGLGLTVSEIYHVISLV